ncbi:hypothetical protein [Chamaesiphon minutus]|uniref:Uncharacterized protein n=1 Tax=Chamaesiphon minutus (strain ATCC 27169 / PCC 6605) TaxID=1173020 RepID=K9UHI0_CHAP6|nr:hypothetical protein [Chamaesiphon minutus]AFY94108.1 hypothetical protein Cha6605_3086 [Chamaesiphon minutus PCC 6605]
MKPTSINSGVIAILCALGVAGIVAPAITVTTPVTTTKTPLPVNTPLPTKVVPPATKVIPSTTVTPTTLPATNPQPVTTPNNPPLVAVPPLIPATLKNFTNVYGQVLGVKFTPNQQQKIAQRLSKDWMTNLGMRNTVFQTIALEPQIVKGTLAERTQIQTKLVANLRQQALDGDRDALWLVSFYDAVPKNWLAPGKPPLNRMTSDMSAEVLCFMINEVMGKSVATADTKLKNAIAAKLTAEYAKIPVDTKQELSRLPTNWLTFKSGQWLRRGEYFREQMRVQWGQNLEAYIPEIRDISKLRRDRLAKLKADPKIQWNKISSIQRQVVFQKSDLEFQTSLRTLPPVTTVQLTNYLNTMQVGNTIGNSPTRYYSSTPKVK